MRHPTCRWLVAASHHRTTNEGEQEMSRMKTAGLVGLLMIGLVGCDGSQDIVSPNYEQDIVAMESSDSVDCPTFEEMFASMVQEIEGVCPDQDFSNRGQLQSCRIQAVNELMNDLPDCYTSAQRLAMKKSVMRAVGLGDLPGHRTGSRLQYTQQ
jgi:hypothetical protein